MVQLRYELARADFLAMRRLRIWTWRRGLTWLFYGLFGAICLAIGVFCYIAPDHEPHPGGWVFPALFVVALAAQRIERRIRQELAWRTARAAGSIIAEFHDEGLLLAAGAGRTFCEWRGFTHYREMPELFLLFQGKAVFVYIPKSAMMQSPGAEDEVRALLEKQIRLTRYSGLQPTLGFPVSPAAPLSTPSALARTPTQAARDAGPVK